MNRTFEKQWGAYGTLWLDYQTAQLQDAIRKELEAEFGAPQKRKPKRVRPAIGWCSEHDFNRGRAVPRERPLEVRSIRSFDGLRITHCAGCGQRIAWKPAFGDAVCGKRCAERAKRAPRAERRDWTQKHVTAEKRAQANTPRKITHLKLDPDMIYKITHIETT